jgi:uncharacterized membrane protein
MTKTRLEAFSDGVIAIIITIMVLEMKIPHGTGWNDLWHLWPVFLSYLVSFINMGIYWVNHHHLLHTIKEVKGGILWANMNLLFWLSLMPFATGWMGENNFDTNTVVLYSVLANCCGMGYYILLMVIKKCNPGNPELLDVLHKQSRKGILSLLFYFVAIGAAFINTIISGIFIVLVAIMWFIPDRNIENTVK